MRKKVNKNIQDFKVVATPSSLDILRRYNVQVEELLLRHYNKDYGNVNQYENDVEENNKAIENGKGYFISVYDVGIYKINCETNMKSEVTNVYEASEK